MKEIINVGVGQAGVQISESLIKLYLGEHNLTHEGRKCEQMEENPDQKQKIADQRTCEHLSSIFEQNQKQTYRPRFLLIDTEPDVINESLKSTIGNILVPEYIHAGKQSANTFARAHQSIGARFVYNQHYENCVRKIAQNCDSLEAFVFNHSIEGGTGSGTVASLMQKMEDLFPKVIKTNFVVGVQKGSLTSVIGPYNAVLALARILPYSDTTIFSCNKSLHEIAKINLDIQFPNYQNINALISQANSSYTVFNRFSNSTLNCDLQDFRTNLVIYPRVHYAIPSFSPLVPQDSTYKWGQIYSEDLLLEKCYDKSCQFALKDKGSSFRNRDDKNLSAIILARGDLDMNRLAKAGRKLIKKKKLVNYLPTALKIGLSPQKITKYHENDILSKLKNSVISYRLSMQIQEMLEYLDHKFDLMYSKRAFLHWYIQDGMQELQFCQARQELAGLQKDYQEMIYSDYIEGPEEYSGSEDDYY